MKVLRNRDTRVQCFLGRSGEGQGYITCVLHSSAVRTGCISTPELCVPADRFKGSFPPPPPWILGEISYLFLFFPPTDGR